MDTMLTTPPLSPKVITALRHLDITRVADIQHHGPAKVFLLLKAYGLTVTNSVLWTLVCLAERKTPGCLNNAEKAYWCQQVAQHPPVAVFPPVERMAYWMQQALTQAQRAFHAGEVPVGAIVVQHDQLLSAAFNQCIAHHDISHHAEIQAMAQATALLHRERLDECDLYITLEPCCMCSGAIIQARIRRVIFAVPEPKSGAAGSVVNLFAQRQLNQHSAVYGGILAAESQALLRTFFRQKRLRT